MHMHVRCSVGSSTSFLHLSYLGALCSGFMSEAKLTIVLELHREASVPGGLDLCNFLRQHARWTCHRRLFSFVYSACVWSI